MNEQLDLTKEVWSEQALCELLGMKKNQVRYLTLAAGLPMRRLQRGCYVVLGTDLIGWLRSKPIVKRENHEDADVRKPEVALHGSENSL